MAGFKEGVSGKESPLRSSLLSCPMGSHAKTSSPLALKNEVACVWGRYWGKRQKKKEKKNKTQTIHCLLIIEKMTMGGGIFYHIYHSGTLIIAYIIVF